MKNRWNDKEADNFKDPVELRAYSSRLLGADSDLVLHGGGNTSVKVLQKNFFGDEEEILYVKGSGYDLATIPVEGFAPVKQKTLLRLAQCDYLSDSDMVREQKIAMINPNAPAPSVEAILHALIPFKYVDHTHADAVVTLTNTPKRAEILKEIYGPDILILPYVMPGFILAKQVYEATKGIDWSKLKGIILLNHGVFTFSDSAKTAYSNMIDIVNTAEVYLEKHTQNKLQKKMGQVGALKVAMIRGLMSQKMNQPLIASFNNSEIAGGFAALENLEDIAKRGTITPDHVIHTKKSPLIVSDDVEKNLTQYIEDYINYFKRNDDKNLTQLDPLPRWAILPNEGTLSFGQNLKRVQVVQDISEHTMKCIQLAESLGGWTPLDEKNLFDLEYWELEQAKLKKQNHSPEFMGKIALVSGAASGIGRAIALELAAEGACVAALDINPEIKEMFKTDQILGIECDLTNQSSVLSAIQKTVMNFGGIDILISNAGSFPKSSSIEELKNEAWDQIIELNLTSHQRLLKACIPYLKLGIEASVVFVASKNVHAPGPGAAAYSTAKAGLTQLGRVAALELGRDGIRVNMVHPNQVFDTGIWTKEVLENRAKNYNLSIEEYKTNNVLHTEVTSHDVAKLVSFISSSQFLKTTGAQIPIDGGNERVI